LKGYEIWVLLEYSTDKDFIATKIIDLKGDSLTSSDIDHFILYLENKLENNDIIITKIIKSKKIELNPRYISAFLYYSKDKELIKKTLLQKGVDYKLINDIITKNKIDIPLIPDNYQEMLNEIKRIKQIIR
jgi:hypothetical protein